MLKEIKLISGEVVNIRARCTNEKCQLLLISDNGNPTTSEKERTIHSSQAANQSDLKGIPFIMCVNCR